MVTHLSSLEFPGLATKGVHNNLAHTCVSKYAIHLDMLSTILGTGDLLED